MFLVDKELSVSPPRLGSFYRNHSQGSRQCNNGTEHASMEQPYSAPSIQLWPDNARHSAFIRRYVPAVAMVRDLDINH